VAGQFARRPATYRSKCLFNKNLPSCKLVRSQNGGAALFTVFVKGAGFSSRNPSRAKKGRIEIGQWEQRMAAQKTRTLEQSKGAAPNLKSAQNRGRPSADDAREKSCGTLRVTYSMAAYFRARFRIESEAINHGQQCKDGN
jgi:hypothetical protein